MNLTKVEKIIIIILVVGGILAAGIFMFVKPAFDGIESANKSLDNMKKQEVELNEKLARESTIDTEIKDAKKEAETLEGGFYPDLTTYEASEIILAYLKECGLSTMGVEVKELTTTELNLETYTPEPVIYDLKNFSQTARGTDDEVLLEGQFKDGTKTYNVSVNDITNVVITDIDGNVIEPKKYTDTMKSAYKEALCEYASTTKVKQVVGVSKVALTVTGKYEDYLKFIDYIFDLERASYIKEVDIPMTISGGTETLVIIGEDGTPMTVETQGEENVVCENDTIVSVGCEISFLTVEQMEELDTIKAGAADIVVNQ